MMPPIPLDQMDDRDLFSCQWFILDAIQFGLAPREIAKRIQSRMRHVRGTDAQWLALTKDLIKNPRPQLLAYAL